MKKLDYKVENSVLAEVLGISNFSTAESAVLELVKNAYDAGAPELTLTFEDNCLKIADNGKGMNAADIENYWMHVGKTSKSYSEPDKKGVERVQAGSKGVGRFALARLAEKVTLRSKKKNNKGVLWRTDWDSSTLEADSLAEVGTTFLLEGLRDKWDQKAIDSLIGYLSKTYCDNKMEINVVSGNKSISVEKYFDVPRLGLNCLEIIRMSFESSNSSLKVSVVSDEFKESAQSYVEKRDIERMEEILNIVDELYDSKYSDVSKEDFVGLLKTVGSFEAEFYFSLKPTSEDIAKFEYKHSMLPETYDSGVILFRNAFSISSYEGSKDWIGFSRRARKSPASPSHDSGNWRVRENQIAGFVSIDKERNGFLQDLANRQGLQENIHYRIFLDIIDSALKSFERYRQDIIRDINKAKNAKNAKPLNTISQAISTGKIKQRDIGPKEFSQLKKEIKNQKQREKEAKQETRKMTEQHRYDVRILNVLATSGLKATSIAHQLKNDENVLLYNSQMIREALIEYGLWDDLTTKERTRYTYQSIPELLDRNERAGRKFLALSNALLNDVEKKRFRQKGCTFNTTINSIVSKWQRDYSQLDFQTKIPFNTELMIPEDVIQVIFDNLILNSIQQNETMPTISVKIVAWDDGDFLKVKYSDNGIGLHARYANNPRRILDVHETTRANGHGLGMWIINNSLINHDCSVLDICNSAGFEILFSLKKGKNER